MHTIYESEFDRIYESFIKKLIIERSSSDKIAFLITLSFYPRYKTLNTRITLHSLDCLSSDHYIASPWERSYLVWKRQVGILTHDYNSSECELFESLHIFGNVPWQSISRSDEERVIHCQYCGDMHGFIFYLHHHVRPSHPLWP